MKTLTVVLVTLVFAVLWVHNVRGADECWVTSELRAQQNYTYKNREILYSSNQISNDTWFTNQTLHKSCV